MNPARGITNERAATRSRVETTRLDGGHLDRVSRGAHGIRCDVSSAHVDRWFDVVDRIRR